MKGKLIVLDGTDGSGKATQTELLKKRLEKEGRQVEVISFPQYGRKSAGMVEEYLAGCYGSPKDVGPRCASMFYACDRYDAAPKIRKWLQEGKIVIANRYVFSSMGHQAGIIADLKERDAFLAWLEQLEYSIFKVPKPDLNILLFVPAETGQQLAKRRFEKQASSGKKQDMLEKDIVHLKEASEAYRYVAQKYGFPVVECAPNGKMLSREEIAEKVWENARNVTKIRCL